jgi:hypothetical protein
MMIQNYMIIQCAFGSSLQISMLAMCKWQWMMLGLIDI